MNSLSNDIERGEYVYNIQPLIFENEQYDNYEIDTNGNVFKKYKSGKTRKLKPIMISEKYPFISISKSGITKLIPLTKLMLYNFSDLPVSMIKACQIIFKDGDFTNTNIDNIQVKRRKDGTIIRQPRVIQNQTTKEVTTCTKLAKRLGLTLGHVSKYVTDGVKIQGDIWKDYYDDIEANGL